MINTVRAVAKKNGLSEESIVIHEKQNRLITGIKEIPKILHTLFTFIINQAYGVPTGDHGVFNMYEFSLNFLYFFLKFFFLIIVEIILIF